MIDVIVGCGAVGLSAKSYTKVGIIFLNISNSKKRDKKISIELKIYDDDEKKARLLHSWQRHKPRLWRARK